MDLYERQRNIMNRIKSIILILATVGAFILNLSGRYLPNGTDGTVVIEQTAGEAEEWTDPVF